MAGVFFTFLVYYAEREQRRACSAVEIQLKDRARVITDMLNGSVKSEMKCGCVETESFNEMLDYVIAGTELEYIRLYLDGKVSLEYPQTETINIKPDSMEGELFTQERYYYWRDVSWTDINRFNVGEKGEKMQILMAFPVERCAQVHEAANEEFWLSIAIGTISIVIFWISSYSSIKNFGLKKRVDLLQVHKEQLIELNLAATGLAHETKNPLGIIRGLAQRITRNNNDEFAVSKVAQEIVEQADITADRLADFMNYASFADAAKTAINPNESLMPILTVVNQDCEEMGVTLNNELGDTLIQTDPKMFAQIITNLLFNSLNAVEEGDSITIKLKEKNKYFQLIIKDTGCGIEESFIAKMFQPYVTKSNGGHGIGLSVVKRCINALDWDIHVESELGKGTNIIISNILPGTGEA